MTTDLGFYGTPPAPLSAAEYAAREAEIVRRLSEASDEPCGCGCEDDDA